MHEAIKDWRSIKSEELLNIKMEYGKIILILFRKKSNQFESWCWVYVEVKIIEKWSFSTRRPHSFWGQIILKIGSLNFTQIKRNNSSKCFNVITFQLPDKLDFPNILFYIDSIKIIFLIYRNARYDFLVWYCTLIFRKDNQLNSGYIYDTIIMWIFP